MPVIGQQLFRVGRLAGFDSGEICAEDAYDLVGVDEEGPLTRPSATIFPLGGARGK